MSVIRHIILRTYKRPPKLVNMLFIPDTKWREIIKSNRIEWLFRIRFDFPMWKLSTNFECKIIMGFVCVCALSIRVTNSMVTDIMSVDQMNGTCSRTPPSIDSYPGARTHSHTDQPTTHPSTHTNVHYTYLFYMDTNKERQMAQHGRRKKEMVSSFVVSIFVRQPWPTLFVHHSNYHLFYLWVVVNF